MMRLTRPEENLEDLPILIAPLRSGAQRSSKLEECEAVLTTLERGYGVEALRDLHRLEDEIRSVYDE